jgi:hypothetical protein
MDFTDHHVGLRGVWVGHSYQGSVTPRVRDSIHEPESGKVGSTEKEKPQWWLPVRYPTTAVLVLRSFPILEVRLPQREAGGELAKFTGKGDYRRVTDAPSRISRV